MRDLSSLVEDGIRRYGRFPVRPANVNPLDERGRMPRAVRRLRLKEWLGFTLIHPDWFSSLIMQDANYLASSEIYGYDPPLRACACLPCRGVVAFHGDRYPASGWEVEAGHADILREQIDGATGD